MKNLIFLLLFFASSFCSAQPYANSNEYFSQLWNPANTYFATISQTTHVGLGNQLDTGTNATALNLYTCQFKSGVSNVDTFVPAPVINGQGNITFTCYFLKCTGSPTVTATPVASMDGVHWIAIPGATAIVSSPTSLTVPVNIAFILPYHSSTFGGRAFRFYGLNLVGSSSSTYSAQVYMLYIKDPD